MLYCVFQCRGGGRRFRQPAEWVQGRCLFCGMVTKLPGNSRLRFDKGQVPEVMQRLLYRGKN